MTSSTEDSAILEIFGRAACAAVALTLAACAFAPPPQPDPDTYPANATDLAARAEECSNRVVAVTGEELQNFKYGCFCGANHPDMQRNLNKPELELTARERASIVRLYLSIKPIDDIDRACQAHDICWARFGRPELSCNEDFYSSLKEMMRGWNEARTGSDIKSDASVCHDLANDMSNGTLIFMRGNSDDSSASFWDKFIGFVGFPNGVAVAGLVKIKGSIMNTYPGSHQRCNRIETTNSTQVNPPVPR